MDNEIKGEGNSINYKYRMHDPRVGRFFAVDPLHFKYPSLSTYQFSANTPIMAVELEGLESSNDPNPTQSGGLDGPQTEFVVIPESGVPLSEVILTHKKRKAPESDYTTREQDKQHWTSEADINGVNMSFEQWKVLHGSPDESYTQAKARNKEQWGSYWSAKYSEWSDKERAERLKEKLWLYTVYFYMAEDVMNSYSGNLGFSAATSRVVGNSYSFKGILAKGADDVTMYRNFGKNEYKSFRSSGNRFNTDGTDFSDKQFWLDEAGLDWWRGRTSFSGEFTMKLKIPKSLLDEGFQFKDIGKYDAISFPSSSFPKLNNNFKIEWIEIRPGGQIPK